MLCRQLRNIRGKRNTVRRNNVSNNVFEEAIKPGIETEIETSWQFLIRKYVKINENNNNRKK